eukprot:symbB.v1.2.026529.t1/scaffold2658.1/size73733/2
MLRRCIPLCSGSCGTPKDGVFLEDGVLPPQLVRRLEVSLAQTPPWQKMELWPSLCKALKLPKLSEVCQVSVHYSGTAKRSVLGKAVSQMFPPAQRYLLARHRAIYERPEATDVGNWIEKLQVMEVERPLQLSCSLPSNHAMMEVDCFIQHGLAGGDAKDAKVQLLLVPGASLASICVELARLLVPNAQDDAAHAREALTTFLASVSAGVAEEVCSALQVPELEAEITAWPTPTEIVEQVAAEQRLLEAAAEAAAEEAEAM